MKKRQGFLRLSELIFIVLAIGIVLIFGVLVVDKMQNRQENTVQNEASSGVSTDGSKEGMSLDNFR